MGVITREIVQFCAEEVERQGRGPIQVAWMVDAWAVAMLEWQKRSTDVGPMLALIITLGSRVEKQNHADSFRTVGVRVGTQICPRPHEVLDLMRRWANNVLNTEMTPEEAYKELMHIHPFADGNGRVGKIVFNALKGTLDKPQMPPNFFNCANP